MNLPEDFAERVRTQMEKSAAPTLAGSMHAQELQAAVGADLLVI